MGKPTMWFPTRSDTNRSVQSQKRARILKFRIQVEEELYYRSSENKGADQLRRISFAVTMKLICAFVFAYADCWFSHVVAQILFDDNYGKCSLRIYVYFCSFAYLWAIDDYVYYISSRFRNNHVVPAVL